eukprot:TRINITY_DN8842_c0_g1_i10.p1 TRINITY_DN8842_c0_g1~~TRINITY_DN8842_c0_g1_i10.p1  ORF type:complete len:160 (+),score=64.58 TRINITY_DN8842_c0_g1_i10:22-480(+)
MIRRPPRSTHCISSAASDVYKRQVSSEDIKEERNKQEKRDTPEFANGKKVQDKAVNLKVTSRSIKDQVDFLTKSIFSRQQAKIKEEQQLEEDMQRLAREYQELMNEVSEEKKEPSDIIPSIEEEDVREDIPELAGELDPVSQFLSFEVFLRR